ncbi:hypothetical protein [Hyalangium versicolor]|uniref:hypothetical protein n=1 Tax=Hyalangium versicolor TaxID=2861190 RepID=UPI001CCB54FA|nr:hypothetical protein [Hyalangium versicolor]
MRTDGSWALPRSGRGAGALALVVGLLASGCATLPTPPGSEVFYQQRAHRRELALRWGAPASALLSPARQVEPDEVEPPCGSQPEGWPQHADGDEELLAPLLGCPSVGAYLALQRGVGMARVVERLGDWSAVRLGALGPLVDAQASRALVARRASFLLQATRDFGAYAEVFALFIVHTSFDDELEELLRLLAKDKELSQTLGPMEAVLQELEHRGLKLAAFPERAEQRSDVLRGLGKAAADALNSSAVSQGARYANMAAQLQQMPPAYQQAAWALERALSAEHFSPSNTALGAFDHLTFGVPLGFYQLGVGTAHGLGELVQGKYEQATRELAPAALLVGLYVQGKAARFLAGDGAGARLSLPELRLEALRKVAWQLTERLGVEGVGELARYMRARREAAVLVGAGGERAAVALWEARGNVARAQAWLAEAPSERPGAAEPKLANGTLGGIAALVDEAAGLSAEVLKAKLRLAELEAQGPRLPGDVALLKKLHATLSTPPPGVPEGYALWEEYRAYRQARLTELEQGQAAQGPLRWEAYEQMRGAFARGLAFERTMEEVLHADARLPRAQRQWLQEFYKPRIETHVGLSKPGVPGLRYADVLVIEEMPPEGQAPRVETFSFKSRYLALLKGEVLSAQITTDAQAAMDFYGGTVDIRRPSLKQPAAVQRVRLVYEGGILLPNAPGRLGKAVKEAKTNVPGVEVLFQ